MKPTKRQIKIVENFIKKETKRLMKEERFEQEISRGDIESYKDAAIQIKKFMDNILDKIESAKLDKHTIEVTALNLKQYGNGWLTAIKRK